MKNLVKKFLVAIFAISTLFSVNSFADDIELWKKSTLNQILQRGELRVGMEPGYMP
ncbi:MAG: amino acid ABC transporter substrate-binding protein, partial [Arcobacter sp.]|nr:amino acid ABC transporter substrate-binding protein [Arcobacter sp.]